MNRTTGVHQCIMHKMSHAPTKWIFSTGTFSENLTNAWPMILPIPSVLNALQVYNVSTNLAVSKY